MSSNAISSSFQSITSLNAEQFQVSGGERNSKIQHLIDDSFTTRVLPLHKGILEGTLANYLYTGSTDYSFTDSKDSVTTALKIAEEFASKERFSVLDIGTGNGRFLKGLKDSFSNVDVIGVSAADFRPTHLSKEISIPNEEYVVGNVENLKDLPALKDRKFDLIVSAVTFRHLSDPIGVLCQGYDMLNQNGLMIVDDFQLNGLSIDAYFELFQKSKCDFEVWPIGYLPARIAVGKDGEPIRYFCTQKPWQTRIRKTTEHLNLALTYDLEKSTPAVVDHNHAQIFYKESAPIADGEDA